jgi:hypothetical protein
MTYNPIDWTLYGSLQPFPVFTNGTINSTNAGILNIDNGLWFGSTINPFPTNVGGSATIETDTLVIGAAQTDLGNLQTALNGAITAGPITPFPTLVGNTYTFSPGVYQMPPGTVFFDKTLVFDSVNQPTAQFIIEDIATGIIFNNCTMSLINVVPQNIFFLANGGTSNITVTNSDLYGTMIASNIIEINKQSGVSPPPINILIGHIFVFGDDTTCQINLNMTVPAPDILTIDGDSSNVVVCYAAGTKILTKKGYVAIEDIQIGDSIVTHGSIKNGSLTNTKTTFKPAIWTSSFTVSTNSKRTTPICIKKGALAQGVPFEDLYVSPGHGVTVGNRLVLACTLVNGTTIVQEYPKRSVTYYHIELPSHSTIIANGVLAESYLDDNNRSRFTKRNTLR